MMTLEHALRLIAMLVDTVTAQQEQVEVLNASCGSLAAEVQRLAKLLPATDPED